MKKRYLGGEWRKMGKAGGKKGANPYNPGIEMAKIIELKNAPTETLPKLPAQSKIFLDK